VAHYVNNGEFLVAMKEYRASVIDAKEKGLPKPMVSNYIGDCILKIATHLSYKPNFINYSYKDDMILDGIENCIHYIDNFDPAKSSNPFAYFTQIIYYAFIRRISKEKKHSYIKNKLIQNMAFDQFEIQEHDEDGHFHNAYLDFMQSNQQFDDFLEKKKAKRKKKIETPSLDDFTGENILRDDIEMFSKDDYESGTTNTGMDARDN
jgi:hypothetical protein